MADLTITTSEVLSQTGIVEQVEAGGTIAAGQCVYRKANGTWVIAQSDGTALESGAGTGCGVALTGGSLGQDFLVQRSGNCKLGASASLTVGTVYVISNTAGGIAPFADLGTADYVSILGVGSSSSVLAMGPGPNCTGAVVP
jgi:hypothetical protein